VQLSLIQGDMGLLTANGFEVSAATLSSNISGTYKTGHYFINDFFSHEENPHFEIGFSGGDVVFRNAGSNNLHFELMLTIGPTAHIAYAGGTAVKSGKNYIYQNEEGCLITFTFSEKRVYAVAGNSSDCGFGARAYLDHEFFKIRDE
jgi:hypothetical protein